MMFTLDPAVIDFGEQLLPLPLVKQHLRVDDTIEDDLIGMLRDAAIDLVQQYTMKRLVAGPAVWRSGGFSDRMALGTGPVQSIESVVYRDRDGTDQVADVELYNFATNGDALSLRRGQRWPDGEEVIVSFVAGYASGACPPALKQAVLMLTAHFYSNREAVIVGMAEGEMSFGVRQLCDRYRQPVI